MAILMMRRAQSRATKLKAWGYFRQCRRVLQICNGPMPENRHGAWISAVLD
jgi:hypothetical protein